MARPISNINTCSLSFTQNMKASDDVELGVLDKNTLNKLVDPKNLLLQHCEHTLSSKKRGHQYFAKHYGGSVFVRSIYLSPREWMNVEIFVTKRNHTLRYYTSSSNHDFSTEHHQVTIRCGLDCCQKVHRTMRKINNTIHTLVGKDDQSTLNLTTWKYTSEYLSMGWHKIRSIVRIKTSRSRPG